MAIAPSDIKWFKSTTSSGSDVCLGGAITTNEITNNLNDSSPVFNRFMRDFTSDEADDGAIQYHCIYVQNKHGTLTLSNIKLWVSAVTPNPETKIRIGLDPAGKNGTATTIANALTEPAGVDLETRHNDETEGIVVADLAPNDYQAIWISIELEPNAGSYNKDSLELRIDGDTPA